MDLQIIKFKPHPCKSSMVTQYDLVKYWVEQGKKPLRKRSWFQSQENEISSLLQGISFDSVLEIGCGDGRITSLILENYPVKKYDAIDVSPDRIMRTSATIDKTVTDDIPIEFTEATFEDFQTSGKYDLVIAVEVLMHVPADGICSFIEKMGALSKNYVVTLDYYPIEGCGWKKMFFRNFLHDYPKLYKKLIKSTLKIIRITDKQALFCIQKI